MMISQLEREVEELEASGMAAAAEDQRTRELCGEYSGQYHHRDDDQHYGDKVDFGHNLIVDNRPMTTRSSNEVAEEAKEGDGQGRGVLHGDVHLILDVHDDDDDKDEESCMEMFI